jgi:thiol-disulfide isomerase/thioredoxin
MKTSFMTVAIYLLVLTSAVPGKAADTGGIQFFDGSWKELLQRAQRENKPIFVDVYTDWCPPCKRMDKEVLPLPEVGDAYNGSFINYKLNAEKGEGIAISKQYEVQSFPSYLYLSPEGVLLARVVDYQEAARFIDHAHEALKKNDKQVLPVMEKQFKEGKRDLPFLEAYIQQKNAVGLDNSEALNAYFDMKSLAELNEPAMIDFMSSSVNNPKAAAFLFLLNQYPSLDENAQKKLTPKLYELLDVSFNNGIKEGNLLQLQQVLTHLNLLQKHLNSKQLDHINRYTLYYAREVKDAAMVKKAGYTYVGNRMSISLDSIKIEDSKLYKQAMEPYWSGKEDSTQAESFEEEKKFFAKLYSGDICAYLIEAISTFDAVLAGSDPAMKDALRWADRLVVLFPTNQTFIQLRDKLKNKVI